MSVGRRAVGDAAAFALLKGISSRIRLTSVCAAAAAWRTRLRGSPCAGAPRPPGPEGETDLLRQRVRSAQHGRGGVVHAADRVQVCFRRHNWRSRHGEVTRSRRPRWRAFPSAPLIAQGEVISPPTERLRRTGSASRGVIAPGLPTSMAGGEKECRHGPGLVRRSHHRHDAQPGGARPLNATALLRSSGREEP